MESPTHQMTVHAIRAAINHPLWRLLRHVPESFLDGTATAQKEWIKLLRDVRADSSFDLATFRANAREANQLLADFWLCTKAYDEVTATVTAPRRLVVNTMLVENRWRLMKFVHLMTALAVINIVGFEGFDASGHKVEDLPLPCVEVALWIPRTVGVLMRQDQSAAASQKCYAALHYDGELHEAVVMFAKERSGVET